MLTDADRQVIRVCRHMVKRGMSFIEACKKESVVWSVKTFARNVE